MIVCATGVPQVVPQVKISASRSVAGCATGTTGIYIYNTIHRYVGDTLQTCRGYPTNIYIKMGTWGEAVVPVAYRLEAAYLLGLMKK